jgi:hypothetical protein
LCGVNRKKRVNHEYQNVVPAAPIHAWPVRLGAHAGARFPCVRTVQALRQIDRMIDGIASGNKPPVLVHESSGNSDSPLVPRDSYDWSEQERVQKAIKAVQDDKSDEMWRRLPAHFGDKRYAMTLVFDGVVNSRTLNGTGLIDN